MILDKKVTRKQFIISALSIAGVFAMSKMPSTVKDSTFSKKNEQNNYSNNAYGGENKNS